MEQGTWQGNAHFCCHHSLPVVGRGEAPQDWELMMLHTPPLTKLDVIVMIALYSHLEYHPSDESIIDLMAPPEIVSPMDPKLDAFELEHHKERKRSSAFVIVQTIVISTDVDSLLRPDHNNNRWR
jgi:hypothetical protein